MTEQTAQEVLAELRAIRALLPNRLRQSDDADPILTLEEAVAFAKSPTLRAFKDWRRKYKVRPVGRNRFSRRDLMVALSREAGDLPLPRTLKRGGKYT